MIKLARIAEFISALLLAFFAVSVPPSRPLLLLAFVLEGAAAVYAGLRFHRRAGALTAVGLAVLVLAPIIVRLGTGSWQSVTQSPAIMLSFALVAILVTAQIVALVVGLSALKRNAASA